MPQTGPDQKLSILAVVAHPHDITHMCGTLAHHLERGDSATAVAMTGGLRTHREKLYDELRKPPAERDSSIINQSDESYQEQKAHEMHQVCALFGLTDVRILPFEDHPFPLTDEAIEALAEIVFDVRPDLILTHSPYGHARHGHVGIEPEDHQKTGIIVGKALSVAGRPNAATQRAPHRTAAIYYTGVDFPAEAADLYVDIGDQAVNRVKAEMLFSSQAHTEAFARKRIEIGAGYNGWLAQVAYAEPWVRPTRQISEYLTVTDEDLAAPHLSFEELLAKKSWRVSAADLG
jgi:4-oxalomesaconate hydratase